MRIKHRLLALVFLLLPLEHAQAETWLFGAAACPPWKAIPDDPETTRNMEQACAKDVALFVDGFKERYDVADHRIITRINAEATSAGVADALRELAAKAQPEDRVILYINIHGGKVEALYKGYPTEDEVFAWYTEKQPTDMGAATANGQWMTARDFRDLVNEIMAEEIVSIIEACHAGFGVTDFINNVHNGIGGRGEDWPGREAVIFSSHGEQVANFTQKGDEALFTRMFSDSLRDQNHNTLSDSFEAARLRTHRQARANCAEGHTHKELIQDWSDYRLMCTQMPTAWDPFGLLDDIVPPHSGFQHQ